MKKVIKFYAPWCGPCRVYAKTWDDVIPKYNDQVEFVDVNIEEDSAGLAGEFKVRSIPHTVLIKEDGSTLQKTGRLSAQELEELILS